MAGHSEWQNRKYRKRRVDRKRAKKFNRLSRKIMRAARKGGGDPDTNLDLKWAIDEAREEDMPNENIERAIKRGTGELNRDEREAARYEGYAAGDVAILIVASTDNRNRTHADLRQIFREHNGGLAEEGSVSHLFDECCRFQIQNGSFSEDDLLELVIEAGGHDVDEQEDGYRVLGPANRFDQLRTVFNEENIKIQSSGIRPVPKTEVTVRAELRRDVRELREALEENLDVKSVYTNLSTRSNGDNV